MNIKVNKRGGAIVVDLVGHLTAASDERCLDRVARLLGRPNVHRVQLDLGRLERIDCSGIGRLVQIYCLARKARAALELTNVDPLTLRLLELTGVADVLCAGAQGNPTSTYTPAYKGPQLEASR